MINKEKSNHSETIFNRFLMSKLVYWMIFDQFGSSRFLDSFSSREAMIDKEKSDHSQTISNQFLMSKLVYRMIFDQFGTFSIFGLLFIKETDDPEGKVKSS